MVDHKDLLFVIFNERASVLAKFTAGLDLNTYIEQLLDANRSLKEEVERLKGMATPATASASLPTDEDDLMDEVRKVYLTEGKLAAVKYYRRETDSGLKDAVDYVKTLIASIEDS